jgi:hypothetical protein
MDKWNLRMRFPNKKERGDQYDQGLKHEKSLLNLRIKKVMKKQV